MRNILKRIAKGVGGKRVPTKREKELLGQLGKMSSRNTAGIVKGISKDAVLLGQAIGKLINKKDVTPEIAMEALLIYITTRPERAWIFQLLMSGLFTFLFHEKGVAMGYATSKEVGSKPLISYNKFVDGALALIQKEAENAKITEEDMKSILKI